MQEWYAAILGALSAVLAALFISRPDDRNPRALPASSYTPDYWRSKVPDRMVRNSALVTGLLSGGIATIVGATIMLMSPRYAVVWPSVVSPASQSVEVLMWCDWRNAPDSTITQAAVTTCVSTGDINATVLNDQVYVIDTTGTSLSGKGWPSAKGLKVWLSEEIFSSSHGSQIWGDITAPPWNKTEADTLKVGESEYRRIHMLFDVADSVAYQGIHPIETVDNNGEFAVEWVHRPGESKLEHYYAIVGANTIYDLGPNFSLGVGDKLLPKDTTMRFEWEFRRTDVDSMTLHARIYVWNGSSFVLRWDDDDYYRRFSGGTTMADSVKMYVPVFYSPTGPFGPGELYTFKVGVNGWDASPAFDDFMYQGAWAMCRNDWCGAYPIAGVEN